MLLTRLAQKLKRLDRYPMYLRRVYGALVGRLVMKAAGVHWGPGLVSLGVPIVSSVARGSIRLGAGVTLCSSSLDTALGVSRRVILRTMTPTATITIGDGSGLSGTVICAASRVDIGARCLIGSDVIIADTDFHPLNPDGRQIAPLEEVRHAQVTIADDVFIGARSIILKGVEIGEGAVVGAGSVVTSNVPSFAVFAGNPARSIIVDSRRRFRHDGGDQHVGAPGEPGAS